jgi:hypothetical protein
MVKGDFICGLAIVVLFSCTGIPREEKPECPDSIPYAMLSKYFDEPVHQILEHILIADSSGLSGLNLFFYYFQDRRSESKWWRKGVLMYNAELGNWQVHFDRAPGDIHATNTVIEVLTPYLPTTGVFKQREIVDSFDFYHLRNWIASRRVEALLNNLSPRQVSRLQASTWDSLFRFFLFYDDSVERLDINAFQRNIDELSGEISTYTYAAKDQATVRTLEKMKHKNRAILLSFKSFLTYHPPSNVFLYRYRRTLWVVAINDEFEEGGEQLFLESFRAGRRYFKLKVYELYYPII